MSKIRKINPKKVRLADIEARLRKSDLSSNEIGKIMQEISFYCVGTNTSRKALALRSKLSKAGYSGKEIDTIFEARKI